MQQTERAGGDGEAARAVERGDRVTLAYQKLRELIVLGRLAPGTRIIETTVAARLGVSRTPVRAALQRLQQEGYVVVTSPGQQSRMSVAPLTQEDAIELFGMVSAVEGLAANGAARRPAHPPAVAEPVEQQQPPPPVRKGFCLFRKKGHPVQSKLYEGLRYRKAMNR